jgi:Ca2+-transporting ATPase
MRISDLTVGDVVCLEPGDAAPADGIVITSQEIKCDESLATGESDHVEKCSGFKAWDSRATSGSEHDIDPFIISGSNILEGIGTYLVTSVGPHSTYGRIMVSLGTETDPTPLQVKLARLASWIGWFGLGYHLPTPTFSCPRGWSSSTNISGDIGPLCCYSLSSLSVF